MIWRAPKYTGPERRKRPRWRPRPFRVLFSLLALAAIGYAAAVIWLATQEARLVSRAASTLAADRPEFPYQQIDVPRADGARQFAWSMQRGDGGLGTWTLFLHGNPTTIASHGSIARYRLLRNLGLNVLAPEYRGFAGLQGSPDEATLGADGRAAYEYLRDVRRVPDSRIVIYGWSLGAAIAVDLASQLAPAALVLEAAPASLADISQQRYPFFPIRLLLPRQFEAIAAIERVRAPILFLHSREDVVVPLSEGKRLFNAAPGEKTFAEVRGDHVGAVEEDGETFAAAIRAFLERHGLTPSKS